MWQEINAKVSGLAIVRGNLELSIGWCIERQGAIDEHGFSYGRVRVHCEPRDSRTAGSGPPGTKHGAEPWARSRRARDVEAGRLRTGGSAAVCRGGFEERRGLAGGCVGL